MSSNLSMMDRALSNFADLFNITPACEVLDQLLQDEALGQARVEVLRSLEIAGSELSPDRRSAVIEALVRQSCEQALNHRLVSIPELVSLAHNPDYLAAALAARQVPL